MFSRLLPFRKRKKVLEKSHLSRRYKELVTVPTAPFREHWVCEVLDELLAGIPGVTLTIDRYGNRMARLKRGEPSGPPLVFVAHTDHPGFVFPETGAESRELPDDTYRCTALFEGRVRDEFFVNGNVRLFRSNDDPGIAGVITMATPVDPVTDNRVIEISTQENPEGALLAMWDVDVFEETPTLYRGRVCDDLMGCAAMVEALARLSESSEAIDVAMLFTRAEEAGFCGTLCILNDQELREALNPESLFVSVEISGETPEIQLGEGSVIRVGDQSTIFDGEMANLIWSAATTSGINARRALMDRGTCEATPISLAGLRVGGICSPVRNYHNMNTESGAVDAEAVSISDCEALVGLITEVTRFVGAGTLPNVKIVSEFELFIQKGQDCLTGNSANTEKKLESLLPKPNW